MEITSVKIEKPDDVNVIIGMSHFIKTVEDVHEALVCAVPNIKFGLAFCESSGPCLVRRSGTDQQLVELATKNALAIGAGHSFVLLLGNVYPINVLRALREVGELVNIFCATANPVEALVVQTTQGRGIVGVVDGRSPLGVETESDVAHRKEFLRRIGYKLG